MSLYRKEPIKVGCRPAMFGVHGHSYSGDIAYLVCRVILLGHVIKESVDSIGRSPSRYITILPSLVAIGTVVAEMQWF